jgi:2-hydroxycyclohexanecarboxyl-CoA dehydrogenase
MKRFENKVAIVTGAGGGIGSAIACRLASEGALVVVTDVNAEAAAQVVSGIEAEGGAADGNSGGHFQEGRLLPLDRGSIHGSERPYRRSRQQRRHQPARQSPFALRRGLGQIGFAVNLDAMFHLCRATIPHMITAGGGAIVNTASQWGLYPAPNHIAYNTTKAAVAAFTQNLARDYAPDKIRVNAVCPGEIHTPMLEAGVTRSGRTIADLDKLVPFGRIGKPQEVAALVAFLASDEAAFMCGSLVEITGAQAVA